LLRAQGMNTTGAMVSTTRSQPSYQHHSTQSYSWTGSKLR